MTCRIGQITGSCAIVCQWQRANGGQACNVKRSNNKPKAEFHYWVSKRGLTWTASRLNKPAGDEKIKYLGFTTDDNWPKKLNTGRVIHKHNKKLPNTQKTVTAFKQPL